MPIVEPFTSVDLRNHNIPNYAVVIGAGTGGPQALTQILPQFGPAFPGVIFVVQQMRPGFTRVLAKQFDAISQIPVYEPAHNQEFHTSEILMVPGGTCLSITDPTDPLGCNVEIDDARETPNKLRSRISYTMSSVASIFGRSSIGVLLTGLGDDGRDGMRAIADAGGITIAQDESTCLIHDMPSAAIDAGVVHQVLPLWSIAEQIISIVMGDANADAA